MGFKFYSMSYIIQSNNDKKYQLYNSQTGLAIGTGFAAYKILSSQKINQEVLKKVVKPLVYSKVEKTGKFQKEYNTIFQQIFDKLEISKKGVKIATEMEIAKDSAFVRDGLDGHYNPIVNKIFFNKNNSGSVWGLHELGHALNKNMGGLGKILLKSRRCSSKLAIFTLAIGLLKQNKFEGEKPKGFIDKTTTFLKKHCGLFAFLSFMPVCAEEGYASIRNLKLAKTMGMSNEALKTLKQVYKRAFMLYVFRGALVGFSVKAASIICDKIAKPKEI